jgi:hypothetical protein
MSSAALSVVLSEARISLRFNRMIVHEGASVLGLHHDQQLPKRDYSGVTNNLGRRVVEHRSGVGSDFVKKCKVTKLVYAEEFERIEEPSRGKSNSRLEANPQERTGPRGGQQHLEDKRIPWLG